MKRHRLLTLAAAIMLVASACTNAGADSTATAPTNREVTTATVSRGDLSTEKEFRASITFGDQWTINTAATGTITEQHGVGTVVGFGEALVRLNNRPLFLVRGEMPMYRDLKKIDTRARDEDGNRQELLQGPDVTQLQTFLNGVGLELKTELTIDGIFGKSTEVAVKAWQTNVGLPATGTINNTQIVFAPDPVRIASASRLGDAFSGLQVNSAEPSVLVDTSNRDRSALVEGATVTVTLPDGTTADGTVSTQEQATASDDSTIWRTTIVVRAKLPGDASSGTVTVTEVLATDVDLVPVAALLALAEGGFAVEVQSDTGPTISLVGVEVGEVLDGQAAVSGNISTGDRVVVAR